MANSAKVSIIIPNWNGKKDTLECLESISKLNYSKNKLEVIVVDNASADGSITAIKRDFPRVRIIRNKENLGYAGAVNIGVKKSKGKFVLLLTNDTVLHKDILKHLVAVFGKDSNIGAAGPVVYFSSKPKVIQKAYAKINPSTLQQEIVGRNEEDDGQYRENIEVEAPVFLCILFKREVFDKIGFLDEAFFHYFEDTDFLIRFKKSGYKAFFVPKAKVLHKGNKSLSMENPKSTYYLIRNNLILLKKHNKLRFSNYIGSLRFMFSSILFALIDRKKSRHYAAIARGIFDFYLGKIGRVNF